MLSCSPVLGGMACSVCCCRFDALRSIVVCFMEAVPLLISVGCLIAFFLFVFGVAGTELFGDAYHKVCMDAEGLHEPAGYEAQDEYGCGARQCPANFTCTVSRPGKGLVWMPARCTVASGCAVWIVEEWALACCLAGLVPAAQCFRLSCKHTASILPLKVSAPLGARHGCAS